jgi:hypothetical protein
VALSSGCAQRDYVGQVAAALKAAAGVCVLPARFHDRELPRLLPDVVAVDPGRWACGSRT